MLEQPDPDDPEQYWRALLAQIEEGPVVQTIEEQARAQFDFACNEVEQVLAERDNELNRVKWVPIGLATGFSAVFGALAAWGWIDVKAAFAGCGLDFLLASYVLERRDSFRKIFINGRIEEYQQQVRDYLCSNTDNIEVRMQAMRAQVSYAELPID